MASDFRSLLSTFQDATGGGGGKKQADEKKNDDLSLKELTEKMWRLTQIKRSTTSSAAGGAREPKDKNRATRLAICLCIVDALPHEEIWKQWMERGNSQEQKVSAELYIHAKHPERITSKWARSKLISISHRPNWNDVRIVKAMLSLVKEALQKDDKVTHIVFGTESCIPICPLQEISMENNRSYVKHFGRDECTRFDELHCWNVVQQYVPSQAIYKALPGWCVLCRSHAHAVLDLPKTPLQQKELWTAFEECWAPEEVYFPTALSLLGLLQEETLNKTLTYAEWDDRARNHKDRAHPRVWDDEFDARLVQDLRRQHGCIFLRKVKHAMPLSRWEQAVMGKAETPRIEGELKRKRYHDAEPSRDHKRSWRHYNGGLNRERGREHRYYGPRR